MTTSALFKPVNKAKASSSTAIASDPVRGELILLGEAKNTSTDHPCVIASTL